MRKKDTIHFELTALNAYDVQLTIKEERRLLGFKWIRTYRFILPKWSAGIDEQLKKIGWS